MNVWSLRGLAEGAIHTMANKSAIYKEILKEYDEMRMNALHRRNSRRNEVYSRIPHIEEIDEELSSLGIGLTKIVLSEPQKAQEMAEKLYIKQKELKKEKEDILSTNKIPVDYLDVQYICQNCGDTGYVNNEKCFCFNQKLVDVLYNKSSLKQIIKEENFSKFSFDYYSDELENGEQFTSRDVMKKNYSQCLSFARGFPDKKGNFFLYGQTGVGKTFMCNCIAKEILDKGINVMYVTAAELFRELEKERFNTNEESDGEDYLEDILIVDLLIIDDLGTEFSTTFTTSQLYSIINTRLVAELSTVISTNLSIKDFSEKYSDRITSRIMGSFSTLRFVGKDIRPKVKFKKNL